MNRLVGPAAIALAFIAAAFIASDGRRALAAATYYVAPGDTLAYDITLDVQRHALGTDPRTSMNSAASGAGTEVFALDRVAPNGAAYAALTVSFRGTNDGRPVAVDRSWRAELAPDGGIIFVGRHQSLGEDLEQALSYVNGLAKGLPSRRLAPGLTWKTEAPLGTSTGSMIITNKVLSVRPYQGNDAYVIEQRGAGAFTQSVDGASGVGSIAMSGTLYYDKAHHMLIGGAARSETEMALSSSNVAHISASTSVNIRLRTWRHARNAGPAAPPATAGAGSAQPSAAPSASSPAPSPAYTPATTTTSTPSPIATGG